jgi:hypothetical protein
MPDRSNPLAVSSVLPDLLIGKDAEDEKRNINKMIQDGFICDQNREGWLTNQRALTKLRYGIRRPKTYPWKGASNLSIPFIDAAIRKYKPVLMRLVVEPDPIVEFVGEDENAVGAERTAESFYNWLFKTEMDALEPLAYLIDIMCHRGFGFAEVGWEYRTEYEVRTIPVNEIFPKGLPEDPQQISSTLVQQYDLPIADKRAQRALQSAVNRVQAGDEFVRLAFKRVIKDCPALWERDPVQVLAPPRTTDFRNAEWIIVQHILSMRKLEQMEADGQILEGSCQQIRNDLARAESTGNSRTDNGTDATFTLSLHQEEYVQSEKERLWGKENEDNILIWECFHWYDHNGDGLAERCWTFVHPKSRIKLSSREYPYPFHQWPLVKFDFEKTNRRWHSPRGISQMLRDLQKEINVQHNFRIDGMALRNMPMYQIPLLAGFKARNFRCRPGEVVQTPAGASLQPLLQDRGAYPEMVNEENLLRSLGENYIGIFDAAITSPQSNVKSRTATEVQAIAQYTAATSTFDTILFQMQMRELHTLIWELWCDLGPASVNIKVLGQNPDSNEAQLITINKADIAKRFKLIPTGTVANTNRALQLSNSREAMQFFLNDQSGFINGYELRRWYLALLDYRYSRRILNPPAQAQEQVVLRQAAAALQKDPRLMSSMMAAPPGTEPEPPAPQADMGGGNLPMMGQM